MSRYLLDTHLLLWFVDDHPALSPKSKRIIQNPDNQVFTSVVSAWEINIKLQTGKLKLSQPLTKYFDPNEFSILPIQLSHVLYLQKLKPLHRDPFDRMLLCQARTENLKLITSDTKLWQYKINIVKA